LALPFPIRGKYPNQPVYLKLLADIKAKIWELLHPENEILSRYKSHSTLSAL
jgi:hypothetical protein